MSYREECEDYKNKKKILALEEDQPQKHIKKKQKGKRRSDHKHEYVPGIYYGVQYEPNIGFHCKICGRLKDILFVGVSGNPKRYVENFKASHPDYVEVHIEGQDSLFLHNYIENFSSTS